MQLRASGRRLRVPASGTLYEGRGAVLCARPSVKGIDEALLKVLVQAADDLGIVISIRTIDVGKFPRNSRHPRGCAVDISRVGECRMSLEPVSLSSRQTLRLFFWLRSCGFRVGERFGGQAVPAVLLGPPQSKYNASPEDNSGWLHVSLPGCYRRKQGSP